MTKYIDADIFVTHCCNSCIKNGVSCCPTVDSCDYIEDLQAFLVDAPAADVAEVVRCMECEYHKLPSSFTQVYGEPGTLTCANKKAPCNNRHVNRNDFCSYGKRTEENHE